MKTIEAFSTKIDAKLIKELDELHEKTQVPKCALVERALKMLLEQYHSMSRVYKNGVVDNSFIEMVDKAMIDNKETMQKLAQ